KNTCCFPVELQQQAMTQTPRGTRIPSPRHPPLKRRAILYRPLRGLFLASLLAGPARLPLLEEGGNSFLSVGGQSIHAHGFFGVGISLGLVEIDLGVERLLTNRDRQRTGFGNARRQLAALLLKFGSRNGHVDESPLDGGESVNHVAGHQHLQSAL